MNKADVPADVNNWHLLQTKYRSLIGQKYRDAAAGCVYEFIGLLDGEDDYYFAMYRPGDLELLSCVGDLEESYGWSQTDDAIPERVDVPADADAFMVRYPDGKVIAHAEPYDGPLPPPEHITLLYARPPQVDVPAALCSKHRGYGFQTKEPVSDCPMCKVDVPADVPASWDAKSLDTAYKINLMWGHDRSQFIAKIQNAVLDAMRWVISPAIYVPTNITEIMRRATDETKAQVRKDLADAADVPADVAQPLAATCEYTGGTCARGCTDQCDAMTLHADVERAEERLRRAQPLPADTLESRGAEAMCEYLEGITIDAGLSKRLQQAAAMLRQQAAEIAATRGGSTSEVASYHDLYIAAIAENAELRRLLKSATDKGQELIEEIAALQHDLTGYMHANTAYVNENAELRKDAGRYRFFRDSELSPWASVKHGKTPADIDAAIDAAIARNATEQTSASPIPSAAASHSHRDTE